jgi:5'-nucleotidase/UDP-sugar diphosphatase
MSTKKFTILHNNDIHGDFLSEIKNGKKGNLIGGLSYLSGYINKVRKEEENVLYVISGDMVQGSLIDAEYKGISTMEIMNYLSPDVVNLGNHEFDYGLPHLLFLEKMANFPIVNANLYIKKYHKRLMKPFHIIKKAGMEILFTGIITEKILDSLKMDKLVGSFVSLEEASGEIGKICNAYKNDDIDLTILLTHIGYESDIALAKLLKPEWGVDMIIGGHTHTVLDKPTKVNNILISQVGRFDIEVDDDTNSIVSYKWELVPITNKIAKPDKDLEDFINSFQKDVDRKYNVIVSKFSEKLIHPVREEETTLGDLVADAFAEMAETDIMLVGSGSIRVKELGPLVTLKDFLACFPYDDALTRFEIPGSLVAKIFMHIMRPENRLGEGECYQVNGKIRVKYNDKTKSLDALLFDGFPIENEKFYKICMQNFHFNNSSAYLGVSNEELIESGKQKVVTTSAQQVLEEWLKNHQNEKRIIEKRLEYTD